jgi:hypothetical protein
MDSAGLLFGNGDKLAILLLKWLPKLERRQRVNRFAFCCLGTSLFVLAATLLSCVRSVPEVRHVVLNARYSLLIASDASEFKDAVRSRVFEHFRNHSNVEVVNISRLKNIQADDFDAVLIMDTCLGWSHFNPSMKAFLDDVEDPDRIILFLTVDDTDWAFTYQGVDAITAASRMEDEDRVAAALINEIDQVLHPRVL